MSSDNLFRRIMRIAGCWNRVVAIVIVAAGIYLAICWQDTPLFESFGKGIGAIWLSILLLLVGGVVAVLNKFFFKPPNQQRIRKAVGWLVLIGSSTILSAVLFMATVKGINHWKYVTAQHYVSNAVSVLDAIKAQNGAYPLILADAKLERLPSNFSYSSRGANYGFLYFDEDGEGIFTFDSSDNIWHRAL